MSLWKLIFWILASVAVIDMGWGKAIANLLMATVWHSPELLADVVIGFVAGSVGIWLLVVKVVEYDLQEDPA